MKKSCRISLGVLTVKTVKDCCVYMHKNKINGKVYIGRTNNIQKRWANGSTYKGSVLFYKALQKYGWDGFEHIILEDNLSFEESQKKEQEYIALYRSAERKFGYNLTFGGEGTRVNDEVKHKLSASLKKAYADPELYQQAVRRCKEIAEQNRQPVCQFDKSGKYIQTFPSMKIAAQSVGAKKCTGIQNCVSLKTTLISYKGYYWCLEKDKDKFQIPKIAPNRAKQVEYIPTGVVYNSTRQATKALNIPKDRVWLGAKRYSEGLLSEWRYI